MMSTCVISTTVQPRVARPVALIYRNELLHPSETFVLSQAQGLKNFQPVFVGRTRVRGLPLPKENCVVDSGGIAGHLKCLLHKACGLAPAMTRSLRELNPVLIHSHFGVDSVSALGVARSLKIPLLVTYHGYDATMRDDYARAYSYEYRRYLRWKHILRKEVDQFIAVSDFVRNKLIEQSFPAKKISVHYVGVDTSVFRPNRTTRREPLVLFAGRLMENKGCEYLIKAMSLVQQRIPTAKLVVIGDGPERASLEKEAAIYLKQYEFLGMQPQDVLRQWMNRAAVFSVPSVTTASGTSEGFGLVFLEAQAVGTPVASFATGGIPEAVLHGTTGLLSPERDFESLAGDIVRLLSDAGLWRQLSTSGIDRVRDAFDLRKQNARLEAIYADVLARRDTLLRKAS